MAKSAVLVNPRQKQMLRYLVTTSTSVLREHERPGSGGFLSDAQAMQLQDVRNWALGLATGSGVPDRVGGGETPTRASK
jgi:hypothetical protein